MKLNIDYLIKIINQDPEELVKLLVAKELNALLLMKKKDQESFLNIELEDRTFHQERDFLQFCLNRENMWLELILKDSNKALEIIKPIVEFEVNYSQDFNNIDFILKEKLN